MYLLTWFFRNIEEKKLIIGLFFECIFSNNIEVGKEVASPRPKSLAHDPTMA